MSLGDKNLNRIKTQSEDKLGMDLTKESWTKAQKMVHS